MPHISSSDIIHLFFGLIYLVCPQAAQANDILARLIETGKCSFCDLRNVQIGSSTDDIIDLNPADLTETYLVHADFSQAHLTGVIFAKSYLNGARFVGADLSGADFTGSELELVDFSGADLTDAIFSGAYLLHARLSAEQLKTVKLCQTTLPDASISNRDCDRK